MELAGPLDEKLKSENMLKEQFSEWGGWEWGELRYANHIFFSDILQNASFRSQIFKKNRLRRQEGIDPLTKILRTPLKVYYLRE